eukprot:3941754-Rhodomonas_salina.4
MARSAGNRRSAKSSTATCPAAWSATSLRLQHRVQQEISSTPGLVGVNDIHEVRRDSEAHCRVSISDCKPHGCYLSPKRRRLAPYPTFVRALHPVRAISTVQKDSSCSHRSTSATVTGNELAVAGQVGPVLTCCIILCSHLRQVLVVGWDDMGEGEGSVPPVVVLVIRLTPSAGSILL